MQYLGLALLSLFVIGLQAKSSLVAIACARNPTLALCSGGNSDDVNFRAADAEPLDEDTRFLRAMTKTSPDTVQVKRYCNRHQEHFMHYCVAHLSSGGKLRNKIARFCPSFKRNCPLIAYELENMREAISDRDPDFIEPPPIPSGAGDLAFDSPIPDERINQIPERAPNSALSPDVIKTCTPDCTAAHCTNECKCAHTHPAVYSKCNPPATSALVAICQAWYNKCPMFKPVSF